MPFSPLVSKRLRLALPLLLSLSSYVYSYRLPKDIDLSRPSTITTITKHVTVLSTGLERRSDDPCQDIVDEDMGTSEGATADGSAGKFFFMTPSYSMYVNVSISTIC